jgi:hypothetical protein
MLQTFNNLHSWANCTGGWYSLPSGIIICYVAQALPSQNRSQFCNYLGGKVLEINTMEDYSALVYYMWKLIFYHGKSNLTSTAIGAVTQQLLNTNETVLIWQDARELVDYSVYGMIRPASNVTVMPKLQMGQILYLKPINYTATFNPMFTLQGLLANDTNAEFICMKPGKIFESNFFKYNISERHKLLF